MTRLPPSGHRRSLKTRTGPVRSLFGPRSVAAVPRKMAEEGCQSGNAMITLLVSSRPDVQPPRPSRRCRAAMVAGPYSRASKSGRNFSPEMALSASRLVSVVPASPVLRPELTTPLHRLPVLGPAQKNQVQAFRLRHDPERADRDFRPPRWDEGCGNLLWSRARKMDEAVRAYLTSIAGKSAYKQSISLMSKIASAVQFGRSVPQEYVDYLQRVCDAKRFEKWSKRVDRMIRRRKKRKALAILGAGNAHPPVRVTKSVAYRYDPADNAKISDFYASAEWRVMRYEALKRDGARCTCCGRTPREHGVVVNVDHIVALRVNWSRRLDLSNLQVMCHECNEGKGARHADDWR